MDHLTFAQLLGNYGEFIGAIAVVVTLGYLAVQVRHSREATEANTKSLKAAARIESGRYWSEETIRMALSPDMATIVATGFEDASRLDDGDRERLIAWYLQHMLMKDALYQQHVDGVLPDDVWEAHEKVTVGLLNNVSFVRVWDAGHIPVTHDFYAYVEDLRRKNPPSEWSFSSKARLFDNLNE
jgi:hypothetical protein